MRIVFAFVFGIFITVFIYQSFIVYQLRNTVKEDHVNLTSVIEFLNSQIKAMQDRQNPQIKTPVLNVQSTTTTSARSNPVK